MDQLIFELEEVGTRLVPRLFLGRPGQCHQDREENILGEIGQEELQRIEVGGFGLHDDGQRHPQEKCNREESLDLDNGLFSALDFQLQRHNNS